MNNNEKKDIKETIELYKKSLTFRGKPIEWKVEEVITTKEIPNAFTPDKPDIEEIPKRKNYIIYDNKKYHGIDNFFQGVFPQYKAYPYKVKFHTDDNVFYLGGNQRAKLQYNVLAYNFGLVEVDEDDKYDLQTFFMFSRNDLARNAYNRMQWHYGINKMVSFGSSLEVKGTNQDVFCYRKEEENDRTTFIGMEMEWEWWFYHLKSKIDYIKRNSPDMTCLDVKHLNTDIYYQTHSDIGYYLTLKSEQIEAIKQWISTYFYKGEAAYPYNGKIPNSDLQFTIVYDDVDIIPQRNIKGKKAMSEYNKINNAEHNKQIGKDKALEKFSKLQGNEWTTKELKDLGYTNTQIDNYCNQYHWIERVDRGIYRRIIIV